ncbi:MAG: hypothetical protein KIS67_09655 [Verrucomicrobiae bacterium]|nr:hypothetical protein [Verrucomicrobiae bacterium]
MKPPPLLLGAALLFWGWQSEFLIVGAVLAVGLEAARWTRARWEFSDEDFSRFWTFCSLMFLAALVYAFTANDGPSSFGSFFQNPNLATQRSAGTSSSRTASAILRWVPIIFFPFIAAQIYSTRDKIPLAAISLIMRRRRNQARLLGQPVLPDPGFHAGYPYFAACLLAASVHAAEDHSFFWGLCALLAWALWAQRSRRFAVVVWALALLAAITVGFAGQRSISQLQRYLEHINPQWFARFMRRGFGFDPMQSRTALGSVGELKTSGEIIIRLEPKGGSPPPTYLRQASYRQYRTPIWFAGGSLDDFTFVPESPPNSFIWPLLPEKTNTAGVNIASYLSGRRGLLPLPHGSGRLEQLNVIELKKNLTGAVLASGPGLAVFDAFYGPGATIDSPPELDTDLSVPDREIPVLDQVIDDLNLRGQSLAQTLLTLNGFFGDQFTYSTWQGAVRIQNTNDTPLGRFLTQTRSGHCEYFATATVLLLRRLEIPARYAVGFAVHESSGDNYVVRLRDAHAWTLVWDETRQIWTDFDTTPASWIQEESKNPTPWRWLSDAWSRVKFEVAKFRWGQSRVRQYLVWVLVPVLALLLYQIIVRSSRRRRREKPLEDEANFTWPGLDSEFYLLEKRLAARGVPRAAGEPLSSWLERVADVPVLADLRASLHELLRLHYRYRFDPLGLSAAERATLSAEAKACLERLAQAERTPVTTAK